MYIIICIHIHTYIYMYVMYVYIYIHSIHVYTCMALFCYAMDTPPRPGFRMTAATAAPESYLQRADETTRCLLKAFPPGFLSQADLKVESTWVAVKEFDLSYHDMDI